MVVDRQNVSTTIKPSGRFRYQPTRWAYINWTAMAIYQMDIFHPYFRLAHTVWHKVHVYRRDILAIRNFLEIFDGICQCSWVIQPLLNLNYMLLDIHLSIALASKLTFRRTRTAVINLLALWRLKVAFWKIIAGGDPYHLHEFVYTAAQWTSLTRHGLTLLAIGYCIHAGLGIFFVWSEDWCWFSFLFILFYYKSDLKISLLDVDAFQLLLFSFLYALDIW